MRRVWLEGREWSLFCIVLFCSMKSGKRVSGSKGEHKALPNRRQVKDSRNWPRAAPRATASPQVDRKGQPIGIKLRKAHQMREERWRDRRTMGRDPSLRLRVTRERCHAEGSEASGGRWNPGPVSQVDGYWLTARVNPTIYGDVVYRGFIGPGW
jgi:hypothetical protein